MGFRVKLIQPDDPVDSFPDPAAAGVALGQPDGLLAVGGDLSPERLLAAYSRGLFPWYSDDQPILWWCPEPRAVIFPGEYHMSRSLLRMLRKDSWQYSLNLAFADVIKSCATNRGIHGTWLTEDMIAAYIRMHELGYAHSVECWLDGKLAGGIYGIRLGSIFFGESMFSSVTGGSKVALSALVALCIDDAVELIDCQVESEHLRTMGMREITRQEFLAELNTATQTIRPLLEWKLDRRDAGHLGSLRAPPDD